MNTNEIIEHLEKKYHGFYSLTDSDIREIIEYCLNHKPERLYQIYVRGSSAVFDSPFTMHSKEVFTEKPVQEDIDKFIQRCSDSSYLNHMDETAPYEVKFLELDLKY